ncbi:unnamed protein product [Hydatigera taeniaeformis]|uniref:Tcp10_C domain-containing protein n=1 Tax=Hydatigena taeniaeformis TaxID=6205 RepID=A0A158RDG1_HYDTA|nr:unnamed protein product [Hydatigera taeniaeformis]
MTACLGECPKGSKSCSGVHLDYFPEDTLNTFVVEKRLPSKMKLNQADATDTNDKCIKAAKLLKYYQNTQDVCTRVSLGSDKSSEQIKRPFLRKNQGRAAWCCRLRPVGATVNPGPVLLPPHVSATIQTHNATNSETVEEIRDYKNSGECYAALSDCDDKVNRQTRFRNDTGEGSSVNKGDQVHSAVYDRELAEFELLERLTEKQQCGCNSNELEDSHYRKQSKRISDTMVPIGRCVSLPATDEEDALMAAQNSIHGDNSGEAICRFTPNFHISNLDSKCLKDPCYESCQSLAQNLAADVCPTKKSNSLDSCDYTQRKDETITEASKKSNPSRRHLPSSACFNTRSECHRPKLGDGNASNVSLNLSSDVCDRSSPSTIQLWIARLEAEINRFNSENAALVKLKMEREEALSALKKERKEFEEYRTTTMKDFETFRQEEIIKLKKERKVLSDYQRSLRNVPSKRDREEIDRLKQQICEEKAESAQRELRLQHQLSRQRMRIKELTADKAELMERIKRLEQAQLILRSSIFGERANQALKTSNELNKYNQNRLDSVSQVVNINSRDEILENMLDGETQRTRAASAGANSGNSASMPLDLLLSRSTSALSGGGATEFPKPLFTCIPPCTSAAISTHSKQQRAQTYMVVSESAKGEDDIAKLAAILLHGCLAAEFCGLIPSKCLKFSTQCRPLLAVSSRNCETVIGKTHRPDVSLERVQFDGSATRTYVGKTEKGVVFLSNSDGGQKMEGESIVITSHPVAVEGSNLPDGMYVQVFANGDKIISLPNGQRELHCSKFKRRIYPDGTVKTVFKDGKQETRYASGRIRIKDSEGNLLVDTRIAPVSQSAVADLAPLLVPPH